MGWLHGRRVVVAGAGISGQAAARVLLAHGAEVTLTDDNAERLARVRIEGVHRAASLSGPPGGTDLVVTSPGWRPDTPLLAATAAAGIEVIGEVELAWRLDQERDTPAVWLAVTGTNGKTTTVGMLESILLAAGMDAAACGNVGLPVVDAVTTGRAVLAVELSSFQLHWSPSVRPYAGAVLNIAEDHLDWHGSMADYEAAKARVLTGEVAVANADDAVAARLLAQSPAGLKIGFTLHEPARGQLGVLSGRLVDRAFGGAAPAGGTGTGPTRTEPAGPRRALRPPGPVFVLAEVDSVRPQGPTGVADALAAAALARAAGASPEAVGAGLGAFTPGEHRGTIVAEHGSVRFVDDSKATNPHAAAASLCAHERVVWIAGGLLKGATVDELVAGSADRLVAVVLIGADRGEIAAALARHAPDVPVHEVASGDDEAMIDAVRTAAGMARPGDVVLLAPAAASMDMFTDYAHRGRSFAEAVRALASQAPAR